MCAVMGAVAEHFAAKFSVYGRLCSAFDEARTSQKAPAFFLAERSPTDDRADIDGRRRSDSGSSRRRVDRRQATKEPSIGRLRWDIVEVTWCPVSFVLLSLLHAPVLVVADEIAG